MYEYNPSRLVLQCAFFNGCIKTDVNAIYANSYAVNRTVSEYVIAHSSAWLNLEVEAGMKLNWLHVSKQYVKLLFIEIQA